MGYREDVALAYSKEGFEGLVEKISSDFLSEEEKEWAIAFLDGADVQRVSPGGSHLFIFSYIKTTSDDAQVVFNKLNRSLPSDEYLVQYLGEDGGEEVDGSFFDNPWDIYISKSINWADGEHPKESLRTKIGATVPVSNQPQPMVDDYTCQCGNTKCSTQETSCWKCGAPIQGKP